MKIEQDMTYAKKTIRSIRTAFTTLPGKVWVYALALSATLSFAGCIRESDMINKNNGKVEISFNTVETSGTTRAGETTPEESIPLEQGSSFRVLVYKKDVSPVTADTNPTTTDVSPTATDVPPVATGVYTIIDDKGTASAQTLADHIFLHPGEYDFYFIAPTTEPVNGVVTTQSADQLLTGKQTVDVQATETGACPVSISFNRHNAMLDVEIYIADDDPTAASVTVPTDQSVTVSGIYTSAQISLKDMSVTTSTDKSGRISLPEDQFEKTTSTEGKDNVSTFTNGVHRGLHILPGETSLTVEAPILLNGSVEHIVQAKTNPITFRAGKYYTLKLKVSLSTSVAAIIEWIPSDSNGNENMGGGIADLSYNGTANCYIANSGYAAYTFDATKKGNGVATDGTAMPAITPESVKIIWQTGKVIKANSLQLIDNKSKVSFQLENSGNALIAVYDKENPDAADAKILWSWHIWATDYNPDVIVKANEGTNLEANKHYTAPGIIGQVHTYGATYMSTNPGKVMMDRNLGAEETSYESVPSSDANWSTFGFMYQWGRKDPFYGSDNVHNILYDATGTKKVTYSKINGPVAIEQTVLHPDFFYYNNNNGNWVTPANENLWNSTADTKTAYDPCPPGWRVPVIGTWSDFKDASLFKNQTNGRFYEAGNVKTWYPRGGLIYTFDGHYGNPGEHGYGLSSTPNPGVNTAYFLYFTNERIDVSSLNSRAYGLSTRCIQEKGTPNT